jgi:hypothetical protein
MLYTKIGQIPTHKYIWVDSRFTHKTPCGLVEAEWVGITSIPGRVWGIDVTLRIGGALYRTLPPHAIRFTNNEDNIDWTIKHAQLWDCYSYQFTVLRNDHLSGRLVAKSCGRLYRGEYLFSSTFLGDGYSDSPDQDKQFIFSKLDNGRLSILPTNRVVFRDDSYIIPTDALPDLRLTEEIYSCEMP